MSPALDSEMEPPHAVLKLAHARTLYEPTGSEYEAEMPFEAPAPSVAMVCAETRVTFSIWNMFGKLEAVALPLLVTVAEKVVALPTTAVEAVAAVAMRFGSSAASRGSVLLLQPRSFG